MIRYDVLDVPEANAQIINGDFIPGSIPVNIPENEKLYKKYVSDFLHLRDIETGLSCLECINYENINEHIVYSLFMTSLIQLIRCFRNNRSRISLNENTFKRKYPYISDYYDKCIEMRNTHFAHDEKGISDAIGFFLVAPDGLEISMGGPVSVVWKGYSINYLKESIYLKRVLVSAREFTISEIDSIGDIIFKKYCNKSREELLSYGIRGVSLSPTDAFSIDKFIAMNPKGGKK